MPMFFCLLAGIIPLSLRNGGFARLPPYLQVGEGQLTPSAPPRFRRL